MSAHIIGKLTANNHVIKTNDQPKGPVMTSLAIFETRNNNAKLL